MDDRSHDLRPLLDSWKYEEGKTVRRIRTPEGREVLQVRLPLGIEQYELDGRPDGERPLEQESWFHHYRRRAEGAPWDFALDEESFEHLRQECMLYYHRYLLFFQISEYKLCARDTRRNLQVLDFAGQYAPPRMAENLEQYRPYIIRMHVMSRALDRVEEEGDIQAAMHLLDGGIRDIESLPAIEDNSIFELEKSRSLRSLRDLWGQLRNHLPRSEKAELEERLREAVEEENYEEAARLRDQIAQLDGSTSRRTAR